MSRLFTSTFKFPKQMRSFAYYHGNCHYTMTNRPIFTPFMACLVTGSMFSYIQLVRGRKQYESLYLEINELHIKLDKMEKK